MKKEQGASAEVTMPSVSGGVFSQVVPETSHKRLSRDPTLDTILQHELKEAHEKSHSNYCKLQVGVIQ